MKIFTAAKESVTNSRSRRRKGLMGVALTVAAGTVALGMAGQTGVASAASSPNAMPPGGYYTAVWRVAGGDNRHTWVAQCASPEGCTVGGMGPLQYSYILHENEIGSWDRTVNVYCYSKAKRSFKVIVKDTNWTGYYFVYDDGIHHDSGDGPLENPALYDECN